MSRKLELARLERERLLRLEERAKARREAQAVTEGVSETVALSRARGSGVASPTGERGQAPYRRLAGLDWLSKKGRLSPSQRLAGERYGICWRRAAAEARIASTLSDTQAGFSAGTPLGVVLNQAEARAQARARLAFYRKKLGDQRELVAACDAICGRELTPREAAASEREVAQVEAVLGVALDLLGADDSRSAGT